MLLTYSAGAAAVLLQWEGRDVDPKQRDARYEWELYIARSSPESSFLGSGSQCRKSDNTVTVSPPSPFLVS